MREPKKTPWTPRPVVMPECKTFADLFSFATTDKDKAPPSALWRALDWLGAIGKPKPTRKETVKIGPYCSVQSPGGHYDALYVTARPEVIDTVQKHTIFCGERDSMTFHVTVRADRTALVTCEHGIILGSVWLAIIDPRTIPRDESFRDKCQRDVRAELDSIGRANGR